MAYHSFLVEPISCHAWNKDRTREYPLPVGWQRRGGSPLACGLWGLAVPLLISGPECVRGDE